MVGRHRGSIKTMSRFKPTERRGPTELRQAQCREAALRVLQDFLVDAPNQIDLAAIAYKVGKLRIEEGGLDNADGRIVVPAEGMGTIRVKTGLDPGRRRFTIAHEIGHFEFHPRLGLNRSDATDNLTIWNDPTEEAEANLFAGELLMPEFLLRPRCRGREPSLALIDKLAAEFSTSSLAAAFQYVSYTSEQVALVVSLGRQIQWVQRSKEFWPFVPRRAIHPHSAAGERLSGQAGDTLEMVRAPAYAWLADFEEGNECEIMEASRYWDVYDRTVTLLWLKDDLSE